ILLDNSVRLQYIVDDSARRSGYMLIGRDHRILATPYGSNGMGRRDSTQHLMRATPTGSAVLRLIHAINLASLRDAFADPALHAFTHRMNHALVRTVNHAFIRAVKHSLIRAIDHMFARSRVGPG